MELKPFVQTQTLEIDAEVVKGTPGPEADPNRPVRRSKLRLQSAEPMRLEEAQKVASSVSSSAFETITADDGRVRVVYLSDVDYWAVEDAMKDLAREWFVERDGELMNKGYKGSLDSPVRG